MISEVTRSKGRRQPAAAAPIPTRLAPGFRFHPTDEELVSYYLKRKVTGQCIRVNAISEVDLYKNEPWDLPPHSRLHSRDLEWYFFTALDRKYSNRSRTNRATEEGYWKTTGKDRPVRHHSRTIGMKKTLVYHTGRAQRGQRTNWVMHEYRLEDDDLSHAGISQDVYVLCRVFQKNGSGPQNGAQYGAPYEEEEWERDDEEDAGHVLGNDPFIGPEGCLHLDDFFESAEQDIGSNTENLSFPKEKILKDEASVEDFTGSLHFLALPENATILYGVRESPCVEGHSSTQNNCYVQLNDIVGEENTCFTSDGYSNDCLLGRNYDISVVNGHSENSPTKYVNGKFLDTTGVRALPDQRQICTVQHGMDVEPYDLCDNVPWVYDSTQLAEDNSMYYDALGDDHHLDNCFTDETSLIPMTGYGFLEELMAYYDATDDTLHYAATDSFVSKCLLVNPSPLVPSSLSAEAAGSCTSSIGAFSVQENAEKSKSSENLSEDNLQNDPSEGKTLMKRLASILESISAPPAFAAEPAVIAKMAGHISAPSTGSFHVTASMIQIQTSSDMGCLESWVLPKHCNSGFLFSYAMDDNIIGKSPRHELLKGHCEVFLLFFRGGFHSFLLFGLVLALSYKLGAYVYCL